MKLRNSRTKDVEISKKVKEYKPDRFVDIKVDRDDILLFKKIISQTKNIMINKIGSKANNIPKNEANPFPPLKFLIHIGKICPNKITDADNIIKSAFII